MLRQKRIVFVLYNMILFAAVMEKPMEILVRQSVTALKITKWERVNKLKLKAVGLKKSQEMNFL